jgi:hypothetical protein
MARFLLAKLLRLSVLLAAVSAVSFALVSLSPIDPVDAYVGAEMLRIGPEQRELIAQRWGLDQPAVQRYGLWLGQLARGNLGTSMIFNEPVIDVIATRFWASLGLMAIAWLASGALGFALGVLAGARENSWLDKAVRWYAYTLASGFLFMPFAHRFAQRLDAPGHRDFWTVVAIHAAWILGVEIPITAHAAVDKCLALAIALDVQKFDRRSKRQRRAKCARFFGSPCRLSGLLQQPQRERGLAVDAGPAQCLCAHPRGGLQRRAELIDMRPHRTRCVHAQRAEVGYDRDTGPTCSRVPGQTGETRVDQRHTRRCAVVVKAHRDVFRTHIGDARICEKRGDRQRADMPLIGVIKTRGHVGGRHVAVSRQLLCKQVCDPARVGQQRVGPRPAGIRGQPQPKLKIRADAVDFCKRVVKRMAHGFVWRLS